jgi:hypothetical protein
MGLLQMQMAHSKKQTLSVYFLTGSSTKSVSVFDSDAIANLLHMEALVATLVKYGNTGEYLPYLAESWQQNEQKTIFKFAFNNKYTDESGRSITPLEFYSSLKFLLKQYSRQSNPPIFSQLIGWENFKNGSSSEIAGIKTTDSSIQFSFDTPISGLLEFLSMPYYGYYNQDNFTASGDWKDNKKIIASGEYSLDSFSEKKIVLKRRNLEYGKIPSSFERIEINSEPEVKEDYAEGLIGPSLIIVDSKNDLSIPDHKVLRATPTILALVELNSKSNNTDVQEYKNYIYNSLVKIRDANIQESDFVTLSKGFFINDFESPKLPIEKVAKHINLRIHKLQTAKSNYYLYLTDLIKNKLSEIENISTEFSSPDPSATIIQRNKSTPNYDLRIKIVDVGYRAENWVIKMMFCSDLGVSLEDPTKNICHLTQRFEKGEFLQNETFAEEFENLVQKDLQIVPFFKTGFKFIYSNSIDPISISQTTNVPRLDMIKILQ